MKILLYCPFSFNLFSNNLIKIGGIETLNYELAQKLAKINKLQIYLATDTKKIITINKKKNFALFAI
jgi:hypothetical protein